MIAQWMIASLLFSLCIAVAAWRADALVRAGNRQTRYLWFVAVALSLCWPALAPVLRMTETPTISSQIVAPVITRPAAPVIASQPAVLHSSAAAPSLDDVLLILWALSSSVLLLRLAFAAHKVSAMKRSARREVIDGHEVLVTQDIGPAVVGGRRGEIFIPGWLLDFDPSLRAMVFRHEEEHRSARDPLLLWSSLVITALLPWNVPLWWMASRLRVSLEIDCDTRTLRGETDRRRYAQLLMLIAQKHTHVPLASTLAGRESGLSQRISIMLESPARRSRVGLLVSALIVLSAVGAACTTQIARQDGIAPVSLASRNDSESATPDGNSAVPSEPDGSTGDAVAREPMSLQEKIYFEFQVDTPALVVPGSVRSVYPPALRDADIKGSVLIQVVVGTDGLTQMHTFKMLKSDHSLFSDAVETAVARMKFTPARVGGRAVAQLVQLPFAFDASERPGSSATAAGTRAIVSGSLQGRSPQSSSGQDSSSRSNDAATVAPAPVAESPHPYFDFQVARPAQLVEGVLPQDPPLLRERNVEGTVLAQFVVDASGIPDSTTFKVLRTPDAALSDAVRATLPTLRFIPAQLSDGRKVKQLVQQPFDFKK